MNNLEQSWKIRDARGLDVYEKSFLYTIASRGEGGMKCEWKRNCEDMGMKKDAYYNRRTSLINKGLITAREQFEGATIYTINNAALIEWVETHSVSQNRDSVTQNDRSATQNGLSVRPEGKRNIKINKKNNLEEHDSSVVPPSSFPENKNKNDKEDVDPAILIGDNTPAVPMVENDEGHSVTQNEDDYYEWNGMKVLRAGRQGIPATGPVVTEVKPQCSNCHKVETLFNGLCWTCS